MKLTPLDIRHKEFKRGMRGYIDAEVDEFLDAVADEFERLFKENIDLTERLERQEREIEGRYESRLQEVDSLQQQVTRYREMEGTLQKTLVTAQHSADDLAAQAQKDAEALMQQTQRKARELLGEAYVVREQVEKETVLLRNQETEFRLKFRAMLESYLKQLGAVDETARSRAQEYERQTQALRETLAAAGSAPARAATQAPVAKPSGERPAPAERPQPRPPSAQTPPAPPAAARQEEPRQAGPPQRPDVGGQQRAQSQQEPPRPAPERSAPPNGADSGRPAATPRPQDPGDRMDDQEDTALTMTPAPVSRERYDSPDEEDTALTIAPLADDEGFFTEEDGANTEFKW